MQGESNLEIFIYSGLDGLDTDDDNVDVEVALENGSRYVATFFTLENLQSLFRKNKQTNECGGGGLYLWSSDMIVVKELTEETIRRTVLSLIEEGEFESAFSLVAES